MDHAAETSMNNAIERVQKQIADLEERAKAQELHAEEASRKQSAWAQTQIALDEKHADLHVRAVDGLEEDVARKELARDQIGVKSSENERQNSEDRAELEEIHESILELRKTLREIPSSRASAVHAVELARESFGNRLDQLERVGTNDSMRVRKRLGELAVYEKWLGLSIDVRRDEGGKETISFGMTCLDPADENRRHTIEIQRRAGEKYFVIPPDVSFPGFANLANAFANDQNSAALLRGSRKGFKQLYPQGSA